MNLKKNPLRLSNRLIGVQDRCLGEVPEIYATIAFETAQQLGLTALRILELIHLARPRALQRSRTGESGYCLLYRGWTEERR